MEAGVLHWRDRLKTTSGLRGLFAGKIRRGDPSWKSQRRAALGCLLCAAPVAGSAPWDEPVQPAIAAQVAGIAGPKKATSARRPNIAIIILDDAGFAATSMFGGVSYTPTFERIAQTGIRYNRFHVSSICSPTRAALLSGRNPHQVGFGQIPETAANYPGYDTIWPKSAASVAEHLKSLGYATAAIGKWHNTPAWEWTPIGPFDRWPTGLGFDYFYGTMGTTSMWEPLLWRGTIAVEPNRSAAEGYNLTTDLVDDAITWLHTRKTLAPDKPYFLYFATTAVHSPHHVASKWIEPYRGKFRAGWDVLRAEIFARQKASGVIPANAVLTPRDAAIPSWKSLSIDEKRVAERQMEVLAGFTSQTDHEIGRLVGTIRRGPNGENTLILLVGGDNGSSGEDGAAGCDDCPAVPPGAAARLRYIDELGGPNRIAGASAGWAFLNNTPFPGLKRQAAYLGAIRVPLVVSWPGHTIRSEVVRDQWLDVTDVAATLYDILDFTPPSRMNGVQQLPIAGSSFAGTLELPSAPSTHDVQYFETFGGKSIYRDGWMASLPYYRRPWGPVGKGPERGADQWRLFHLDDDFSQSTDLASANPAKLRELVALFDREAKRNNVYPSGELHLWFEQLPSLTWRRSEFTFYPDTPILSWDAVPDFSRAHRITARISLPDDRASGLVMSSGMRRRGFALYLKDGFLVYEGLQLNQRELIKSAGRLAAGEHEIAVDVSAGEFGSKAVRRIRIDLDGKPVSQGQVPATIEPFYGSATLSIGVQHGSPVSPSQPKRFSGTIRDIRVKLAPPEPPSRDQA